MPNETRKWLYDQLAARGVNLGTYEQYEKAFEDEKNIKWFYDTAVKKGFNMGTYDQFAGAVKSTTTSATPASKESGKPALSMRETKPSAVITDDEPVEGLASEPSIISKIKARRAQSNVQQAPIVPTAPVDSVNAEVSTPDDIPVETNRYLNGRGNPYEGYSLEQLQDFQAGADEDIAFLNEYQKKWDEYQSDVDNDLVGPEVDAKKRWLDNNNERYRKAKVKDAQIRDAIGKLVIPGQLEELDAVEKEYMSHVNRKVISTGGMAPGYDASRQVSDEGESSLYESAAYMADMTRQVLKQGSKWDKGYGKGPLSDIWTAFKQFGLDGLRNIDLGSFTMGGTEGTALIRARKAGDHSNEITDRVLKDMGHEEDADSLLANLNELGQKLSPMIDELNVESNQLKAMAATYESMVKSGADPAEIDAYAKKYNTKLKAYNSRIEKEYNPLAKQYEDSEREYNNILSAIEMALEKDLSEGEHALLDSFARFTNAQSLREGTVSVASQAGQGAEQSAEFMLDFYLTGGLETVGTKLATNWTAKSLLRKYEKELVKKGIRGAIGEIRPVMSAIKPSLGKKFVTEMGVALAREAILVPRNLSAYGEQLIQMTGRDNFGRYNFDRSHLNAAFNTALTQYIEYWSEGFGGYFGEAEKAVFKNIFHRAPATAIGKTLTKYRGSLGSFFDRAHFDGQINEMLEEVVGSTFNALAGWMSGDKLGDSEALKDFFSGEQLATLYFSFLPMTLVSGVGNIKAYHSMRKRFNDSLTVLNPFINSGQLNREDLDELVDTISSKTPEQIKDKIVELTDKVRKSNGGKLPVKFAQSLVGYCEGAFSMQMDYETWEDSEDKVRIATAYSDFYAHPDIVPGDVWELEQAQTQARSAAEKLGVSADILDRDPYEIVREADKFRANGIDDVADALMEYAVACSNTKGLEDGYKEKTNQVADEIDRLARTDFNIDGNVLMASMSVPDGKGGTNPVRVLIKSKDAKIGLGGRIAVSTGVDGVVAVAQSLNGQPTTVKAGQLSEPVAVPVGDFVAMTQQTYREQRAAEFEESKNTVGLSGRISALNSVVGRTILIEDGAGNVSPVTVMSIDGMKETVSVKEPGTKGAARSFDIWELYEIAQKDPAGDLVLDPTAPENKQSQESSMPPADQPEAAPQPSVTPAQPTPDGATVTPVLAPEEHLGEDVEVVLDGNRRTVTILDVSGGNVYYEFEDENGDTQTRYLPYNDFMSAMEGVNPPVVETPAEQPQAPAAEETPAEEPQLPESKIPVDPKTGKKIYDAPEVTPEMAYDALYGDEELTEDDVPGIDSFVVERSKAATRAYEKSKKKIDDADSRIEDARKLPRENGEDIDDWKQRRKDEVEKIEKEVEKEREGLPELERKKNFWDELRAVADDNIAERKEKERIQKLVDTYGVDISKFSLEPQGKYEYIANALSEFFRKGGRITWDSVLARIGNNQRPDLNESGWALWGLSSKSDAWPLDQFVHDALVNGREVKDEDQADVMDWICEDVFKAMRPGELFNYIFNNRLNAALKEKDYVEGAIELEQQNGASSETETAEEVVDDLPEAEEETIPAEEAVEEAPEGTAVPEVEEPVAEPAEPEAPTAEDDILLENETQEIRDAVDNVVSGKDTKKREVKSTLPDDFTIGGMDANSYIRSRYDRFKAPLEKRREEIRKEYVAYRTRVENEARADILRNNPQIKEDNPYLPDYVSEEANKRLKNDEQFNALDAQIKAIDDEIGNYQTRRYNALAAIEEIYESQKPAETPENNAPESSETPGNSVPSQEEETPAQPEGPQMLTEDEIRNSGFADEDVIDAAVDYINGNHGFAETLAYNQIEEYVRSQRSTTEQTGSNADQTQLDGPVVRTGGMAAEQSGSQPGELGGNQETGASERIPGSENGGVSAGVRGAANAQGTGLPSDVQDSGSERRGGSNRAGQSGRSSDDRGAGSQSAPVAGQSGEQGTATQTGSAGLGDAGRERNVDQGRSGAGVRGGQNEQGAQGLADAQPARAEIEAGSTDIEALGGELEDLLKQFSNTTPSIDRDINGLDSVSYSVDTSGDEEGSLSRKQPKRPTAPLSLEGMTPQQMQLAGKILFSAAKLGYAFAKTEGLTTYNDFHRWFTGKFGDAVMKGLNYNETSLDAFIREVWNTKMKIDGERLTLEQHSQELHNAELREQSKKSDDERTRLQKEANEKKIPFKAANRKNIAEALPKLIPGQWDDVVAIERQFFDPSHNDYDHAYGKGMLITNGTGTGKTFTGLGVIKRFLDQGKGRILLVAPASMTGEWVDKAKIMGITATKLANTKDKGKGVVVTSYENFRENRALYEDDFDLVVYDECQNIIENQKGEDTLAFEAHKRITNKNVEEAMDRLVANTQPGRRKFELEQENDRLETERKKRSTRESRINEIIIRQREIEQEIQDLDRQIALLKPSFQQKAEEAVKKTKVLMLSATPFNTVQNLKFAEGYIFQYPKVFKSDGTEVLDEASRQSAFVTEWFRGDEPMEDMEIAFGDHLLDELETASYRELENGFDHSRDFPDVSGNVMASRFNAAWQAIQKDPRFQELREYTKLLTDPTWTTQLFETMKVSAIRERLKEHLDAGRKIVIFHDRVHETQSTEKRPAVGPPFATVLEQALLGSKNGKTPVTAIAEFRQRFADVLAWEQTLDYRPVHEQIVDLYATDADRATFAREMEEYNRKMQQWQQDVQEFERRNPQMTPEELYEKMPKAPKRPQLKAESVAVYNGEKTNAEKDAAKAAFNDDNSKVKIICVTTRSGGAGLSLHDTTGKFPRVMIQTALPVSPIGFIQAEGRIFRWGNQSNAVFEYPRLGIKLEAQVFAEQFNAKAETVENLAHGFRGRGLKDSIMTGFWENTGNVPIDGQGIGGVEMDKRGNTLKGMAKAKHDYGVVQRKGVEEGDTSIPEPVGFKMAEWAKAQAGDSALIPFAGRGSIARYVPKGVSISALEDNVSLQSDLMVTSGGADFKIREGNFTELNMINKADVVLLSGATDQGGLDQIDTFKKGFGHLSEGGRLIAIVPDNAAANNAIAEITGNLGGALRATIKVRNEALDRGEGTSRIVVLDKISSPQLRATAGQPVTVELTNSTKEQVFDLLENVNIPDRIIDKEAIAIKKLNALGTEFRKNRLVEDYKIEESGRYKYIRFKWRRKPNGFTYAKRGLEVVRRDSYYDKGSGVYINLRDFENPNQYHQYIKAYQLIGEVLQMDDAEFRKFAMIDSSAKAEDVDALRDLYRLYQKMIRAAFGLTDSQIRRVLQGMRPDVSASDIETLNSYEELRAKFEAANHDDQERQDLYDKIAPIGEQLGLTIGAEAMDRDFLGGYNNVDNSLKVNKLRWNTISDDKRATTLLHEFIHSVTVYALAAYNTNAPGVSDALFTAAKLASDVFDQVQRGAAQDVRPFTGFYAIENEKEIMAEMANPEFREKLKNRRMWVQRSPRGIRVSGAEMEGAELTNAWALLNEALDGMLKNFDKSLFDRFRGRVNDFFWEVDREGKPTREADGGRADENTENNTNFVDNDRVRSIQTGNGESAQGDLGAVSGNFDGSGSGSLGSETAEAEREASARRLDVFQRGLAAERSKYLEEGNRAGGNRTDETDSDAERDSGRTSPREAAKEALVRVARENGLFIEPSELRERFGREYDKQGYESVTLVSDDGKVFTKLKDPFRVYTKFNDTHTPFDVVNEVVAHNVIFQDTPYRFLGVTVEDGRPRLVLQQDAVKHNADVQIRQMAAWFAGHGFDFNRWSENASDGNVKISDIDGKNVFVTPDGSVRAIDPMIHFLKEADAAIKNLRRRLAGLGNVDISAHSKEHPLMADITNAYERYEYESDDTNWLEKAEEFYEFLKRIRPELNDAELGSIEDNVADEIDRILSSYPDLGKISTYKDFFDYDIHGLYSVASSYVDKPVRKEVAIATDEEANADNLLYREDPTAARVRQKEDPKKTIKVYKLMRLGGDGKLYPLFIDSSAGISIGEWYDAESPDLDFLKKIPSGVFLVNPADGSYTSLEDYANEHGFKAGKFPPKDAINEASVNGMRWVKITDTEKGQRRYEGENRKYENIGINGSGSVSTFAMRPGWHAGSLPTMRQIGKGAQRNLRDDSFVWVEGEVPADVDYNAEAQSNPDNDIPTHIPTDGYYMKSTNANAKAAQADKVGWYVAGSFKANRIISDAEARAVINEYNTSHQEQEPVEYDYARESGKEFTPEERRISAAEREVTNATLDRMSGELGMKINRVGRSEMPRGHKSDKGYYNPSTGEMTICMDNVTDERDAIATVLHETVGHHGLRKLFGDRFNDAMARIYAALDQKGRTWVNAYIARHPNADNTRAVEEYLSHLAESGNFKNTVWDNIRRIIGRIVDALFGTHGFLLTDNELNYILRASYENLKNPNWLNTVEGRAFDTLLKRQLGINEADPNKPTDPQGPDAGNLYRDGDTGVANDDYNLAVDSWENKMFTENQDADRPVKIGMDKVMKEKGIKSISEDEDYLTRHNIASSRAESQAHEFELFRFNPLLEQVRAIRDRIIKGKSTKSSREEAYERILDYMYGVSGLERNAYKNAEIEQRKQDALADAAAAGITDPAKLAEIEKKYEDMKKDWSGLTSLMGLPAAQWRVAEARAQAMVDAFRAEVGDDAVLDELWNRVRACTDFSLEHAYKYGLLTRDEFEKLHGTDTQPRMWEYYLPLRGFNETTAEEQFSYANFVNPSRNSVVVKKMNGRWTKADNPLANILNIAETEIVQGLDNWAKQALYRFTLNAGENTLLSDAEPWYVKDPATGKWSMAEPYDGESLEDFEKRMQQNRSLEPKNYKKGRRGLKLENIMANKAHRNEHAIHLKVGGVDKMIWVNGNPAIARAVSGIGRAQNMQWLRRASRVLSNLFTTYSLDFTAKNLIRDTVYSNIALHVKEDRAYRHRYHKNWVSNFGYGAFAYPMVRLAAEWDSGKLQQKDKAGTLSKREQDFLNFMRDGGQTGYTIINSVSQIKKDLERSMRRAGDKPGTVPIFGWYAKAVKTLNEGFELLTRFTAYQTSRDMGRSGQRAASDAKEISVNFNRRGAQSGDGVWGNIAAYLGATHYFYNAGVQGFDNFLGLFKKKPYKMSAITAGFVMMGVLTPLINSMLAGLIGGGDGDDDWYWNLPEWVRRNNLVIGTGKWYVALPLPVEFRAPYGIGDIAGAAFAFDKYPNRHFGNVAGDIVATASGILPVNPVEGYNSNGNIGDAVIRAVAPDAGMFFVDWATNRDYTGRPLWKENPFSDTVPKSQGAYASTPKGIVAACQKLAEVSNGSIDIAPGVVRDFMNNYGGGFFRAAEDVSKLLFTDEERPRRWDNVPFFSGFTGHIDEDRSNSFAQGALYDYKKLSEDNVKDMNAILNTDDVTSAVLYDEPESLYEREGVTVLQKAKIKRMLDSKDYALGKMYREGMNNKYKMKQSLKDGHWYKSREVERKGVNALRQEWKDLRDQWAKMPDKTEEQKSAKAEMDLKVQEAWHLYYDAMGDLAEKLMDYEYNK